MTLPPARTSPPSRIGCVTTGTCVRLGGDRPDGRGRPVTTTYVLGTHRTERRFGLAIPSNLFALNVARLVADARSGRAPVRVSGPITAAGRRVFRLGFASSILRSRRGRVTTTHELLVDAVSHQAVAMREDGTGIVLGQPYFSHYSEHLVSQRVLPDTPRTRRLLDVRVPIPPR